MSREPWYRDGLRFSCTGCGDCCTGEPGYVWVSRDEVAAIAKHLGLGVSEFKNQYTRQVGRRRSLLELTGGDCVFFDRVRRVCRIYRFRPLQCRTWPFWSSNVKSQAAWEATSQVCPGAGQGEWHGADQIRARVASRRV